jgi:thymidylate synthase (FAD)
MKLIESKAEYIPQEEGLEGIYKQIELAGRTAYHSMDKITPDSAKNFVDRMIKSRHGACLEHGTVYLKTDMHNSLAYSTWDKYRENPYSKSAQIQLDMRKPDEGFVCATTNYRVLQENNWLDDLQYLCTPTEFHEKRYTMRFTCSRAIANELVRSRTMSFLQESQRYINYSKERHGEDITFIKPLWLNCSFENIPPESELCYLAKQHPDEAAHRFIASLVESKYAYMTLLQKGCFPQQARDVLPNATKTELIMTGFSSDWRHVMDLRLFEKTGKVHPDMKDLMQKAQKVMQEVGIWDDIMSKPSKFE